MAPSKGAQRLRRGGHADESAHEKAPFRLSGYVLRLPHARLVLHPALPTRNFMNTSKNKAKPATKPRPVEPTFAAMALRAIRKAQRTAAQENARYGLPLIVQGTH